MIRACKIVNNTRPLFTQLIQLNRALSCYLSISNKLIFSHSKTEKMHVVFLVHDRELEQRRVVLCYAFHRLNISEARE